MANIIRPIKNDTTNILYLKGDTRTDVVWEKYGGHQYL